MSIPRFQCQGAVLDEEIYVIGGFNYKYLSAVESYNPITNKWTTLASMNEKRGNFGVRFKN